MWSKLFNAGGKINFIELPTLLFFKDGEIVDKHVGSASKSQLEDKLNSLI